MFYEKEHKKWKEVMMMKKSGWQQTKTTLWKIFLIGLNDSDVKLSGKRCFAKML